MELLAVYDDEDIAEEAKGKIDGPKRLASDRDDNQVVWRLFGTPSWGNFYALGMYELPRLKALVEQRKMGAEIDTEEHKRILSGLNFLVSNYKLTVPKHWL